MLIQDAKDLLPCLPRSKSSMADGGAILCDLHLSLEPVPGTIFDTRVQRTSRCFDKSTYAP
eukprot:1969338-Amphidinium_carterae.1